MKPPKIFELPPHLALTPYIGDWSSHLLIGNPMKSLYWVYKPLTVVGNLPTNQKLQCRNRPTPKRPPAVEWHIAWHVRHEVMAGDGALVIGEKVQLYGWWEFMTWAMTHHKAWWNSESGPAFLIISWPKSKCWNQWLSIIHASFGEFALWRLIAIQLVRFPFAWEQLFWWWRVLSNLGLPFSHHVFH